MKNQVSKQSGMTETIRLDQYDVQANSLPLASSRNQTGSGRYCGACGYKNPENVQDCLNCTATLGLNCRSCGQAVSVGSKFCGQCGTRLAQGKQSPPASLPESNLVPPNLPPHTPTALAEKINSAAVRKHGERRDVTVLFLDVTNFTAASHTLDSEDVYLFIDEAMSLLVEVIRKYEGTIDKFTGDGLMALFGVPSAHENDPERAIRAALEMQTTLRPLQKRLKQTHDFDFQTRIGINTGLVIAGNVGSNIHMEYTVIGDTVNTASRLEAAAEPGTIMVSAETYQRTRPLFEFKVLPSVTVKGIPTPLQAYRPVALLDKPGRIRGLVGLQVPMVGRAEDLDRLKNGFQEVQQLGQRRIALITGEAGMGKSRLVSEFQKTLVQTEVQIFQGGCLDYTNSRPLWVIIELLRDILHLPATSSPELQQKTLETYLEHLGLAHDEVFPYLAQALGLKQPDLQFEHHMQHLDPDMLQQQLHAALRQVLLKITQEKPTVLILEDLHWIDPASRSFLQYLIQTSSDIPFLLVLVSRQAERKTVIKSLLKIAEQNSDALTDIQLQPLDEAKRQILIDQLIEQTTPEAQSLKRRIAQRAEGNPFYVEEIIRMLLDQGGLIQVETDQGWHVTPKANELLNMVPGTIKGLILARFDRLPESVRQTLQKASVIGISFPVSLLQMLSETPPEGLKPHLTLLENLQFLSPHPFRTEAGYTFYHALVQEAIYKTLLKRGRRKLHSRVAQALEHSPLLSGEERTEALALHYAESTSPAKAIPHLITAAENAAQRCAQETAIERYRRVIDLLPDRPNGYGKEYFQVRLGLGRSLKMVGQFSQAGQILSEVLQYLWGSSLAAEAELLWPILVQCFQELADVRQREGVYDEALAYLDAGIQILGEGGGQHQPKLWRAVIERMAWIRFRQGQLGEAFILADSILKGLDEEAANDPITLAKLYNTLGGIAWQQGQRENAVGHVKRSLQLYESVGYIWGVAIAYGNLGILYDVLDNWSEAAKAHERAYTLQQSIGDIEGQARSFDNVGLLHMAMGEHSLALDELRAGLSIRQRLGDSWGVTQSSINLAHLAIIQQRYADAAKHAKTALSLAEVIGHSEGLVPAYWILALVHAEQGELEVGLQSAQEGLEIARANGFIEGETDCLRVLGILQARMGHYSQAETLLNNSVSLSIQQNTSYRQGLALLELGRVYYHIAQANRSAHKEWQDKALTTINAASHTFEALGARYDLQLAKMSLAQL